MTIFLVVVYFLCAWICYGYLVVSGLRSHSNRHFDVDGLRVISAIISVFWFIMLFVFMFNLSEIIWEKFYQEDKK